MFCNTLGEVEWRKFLVYLFGLWALRILMGLKECATSYGFSFFLVVMVLFLGSEQRLD